MRTLIDHQIDPADPLSIQVTDDLDRDGINHRYEITGFSAEDNGSAPEGWTGRLDRAVLLFQDGETAEAGVNGVTQEALLAVVLDRLQLLVSGPYAEPDRLEAIQHVQAALAAMHRRPRITSRA